MRDQSVCGCTAGAVGLLAGLAFGMWQHVSLGMLCAIAFGAAVAAKAAFLAAVYFLDRAVRKEGAPCRTA